MFLGFVIEGFQLPYDEGCLKNILSSVVELLPEEKPRFIAGLNTPSNVTNGGRD